MDLGLAGKVAVVTGASRGIGRAIVHDLLAEGARVVAGAREPDAPDGVLGVAVDLATPEGPARLVDAAVRECGGVDLVVNNVAAVRLHFDGFTSISDEDWQWAFEITFMSAVRTIRAALPHLLERRGAVVNVSSLNGEIPATEAPEYSAMKAAMLNLSRSLALELASQGVRVNAVLPGPVYTDMQMGPDGIASQLSVVTGDTPDDYSAAVEKAVPMGRWAQPEEVSAAVIALLSDRFGYVTGARMHVDGAVQTG